MDEPILYRNAPLVLVALEVRHPSAPELARPEIDAIKARMTSYTPLLRQAQTQTVELMGPSPEQTIHSEQFYKLTNRESTLTVSYRSTAILIEASSYPGWAVFREVAKAAIAARMEIAPVDAVERVGLRYIDEIRVPQRDGGIAWGEWMDPSMLGPMPTTDIGLPLSQWQGIGIFGAQPGRMMVVRYGPQVGVAAVFASELKRTSPTDEGPFFLMDIDSFWTPEGEIPELGPSSVESTCDDLHGPVSTLFEGLITDKLREVFGR